MPPVPVHVELLRAAPRRSVAGCPEVVAHQAADVFDLWQRWEQRTGSRQEPPFWATVWPGAALLCRVLLDRPAALQGVRVFDVGCGSGVVGIAALLAGARAAIANDTDEAAVDAAIENAHANGVSVEPSSEDFTRRPMAFGPGDLVVLSELFYDASSSVPLRGLASTAVRQGARVLVADGGRAFLNGDGMQVLQERRMKVDRELEGVAFRDVRVLEWSRSSG